MSGMKNRIYIVVVLIATLTFSLSMLFPSTSLSYKREKLIDLRNNIISEQITQENYRCCLKKPCTYCIEKTPGHGEGAKCNCLDDIYNGKHPCGECIGEILEGHGNPLIAEYFATALSEELGEEYKDTIKEIIADKYNIPVEDQR